MTALPTVFAAPPPPAPAAAARPPATTRAQCPDMEPSFLAMYEQTRCYTMTSIERMYALHQAVRHIIRAGVAGDLVECGVWRGGSAMMMAMTLLEGGDSTRRLWLYDTFEGMTPAGEQDIDYTGTSAAASLHKRGMSSFGQWCHASLEDVQNNLGATGYPPGRINCVRGRVEQTIPAQLPDRIALLRLDTDWYESTRHELEHLYPRLVSGGVLIIDDYGHWQGCRRAVDEFFRERPILLNRIDYTGRIAIKP